MPIGAITRGTTNTNRLRRVDRFIARSAAFRASEDPLVVDLGFGASAVTALETADRLRRTREHVHVHGLEIDPERVRTAQRQLDDVRAGRTSFPSDLAVTVGLGGFETPAPDGRSIDVIRAFNVLRQYDEHEVAAAWSRMVSRLSPTGALVEGTCDEVGRIASWVTIPRDGPATFTISLRLTDLERPSIVAERLPKALIHRNVPGEPVHDLLRDLDRQWTLHAPLATYGPVQRFIASVEGLRASGRTVVGTRSVFRLGELTVPWEDVAPIGGPVIP
ncbi:class I SAM-dependent methyltransferase [Labedella endophytica]|uniref:Class I SAM-dependent methyltransferase n=1 Tax=Labedella endophytica TaxID=1523160 RepID=A0A433JPV3_9MICO|nr:class I SAM-dependent methyltransferase [Labedella endophytica]RUQ99010.1 class I SAM-dependent methyltransferase [Labedella endophytica]